jgi:hypothetical protein
MANLSKERDAKLWTYGRFIYGRQAAEWDAHRHIILSDDVFSFIERGMSSKGVIRVG